MDIWWNSISIINLLSWFHLDCASASKFIEKLPQTLNWSLLVDLGIQLNALYATDSSKNAICDYLDFLMWTSFKLLLQFGLFMDDIVRVSLNNSPRDPNCLATIEHLHLFLQKTLFLLSIINLLWSCLSLLHFNQYLRDNFILIWGLFVLDWWFRRFAYLSDHLLNIVSKIGFLWNFVLL